MLFLLCVSAASGAIESGGLARRLNLLLIRLPRSPVRTRAISSLGDAFYTPQAFANVSTPTLNSP